MASYRALLFIAATAAAALLPATHAQEWQISRPRIEYLPSPAYGIDVPTPRFGWVIDPLDDAAEQAKGMMQQAFQLVVQEADKDGDDAIVWDSGKVISPEQRHVVFGSVGQKPLAALQSATAYDWTVRVWLTDDDGTQSASPITTTEAVRFVIGFLHQDDWKGADWLTGATRDDNLCRHQFHLAASSSPKRAILLIAGLGYFKATLNGQDVSDAELETAWTEYKLRIPYSTYDVTGLLQKGAGNVLGVSLGNGWYSSKGGGDPTDVPRIFIAKLIVDRKVLVSTSSSDKQDQSWTCGVGPITYDSIYNGEIYDARLEVQVAGWNQVDFAYASHWHAAQIALAGPVDAVPGLRLVSPKMPPIRRIKEISPVSISEPQEGVFVVDFGQNFAGRVALTIPTHEGLKAGHNITLRHAEVLQHEYIVPEPEKGMIYTDNLRAARATDVYIFGDEKQYDDKEVIYEPTFTYHGFRYVEIRGFEPRMSDIKAYLLHSAVEEIGSIAFSCPLLNQIQSAIHWGQRSNIMSIPTDCPQRDERKGWLGDAQLSGEEALFNFDMIATLIKFLHDIVDTQNEDGQISDTAPFTWGHRPADPSWGTAFPSIVYFLYKETGDIQIIRDFYSALVKYMDGLIIAAETAGVANLYKSYGDWCNVPGYPMCSPHLTGSFSMLENIQQMKELALALGPDYQEDALIYSTYHTSLSKAFHVAFYKDNTYDNGQQTCLALPLWANVTPPDLRPSIVNQLLTDLTMTHNYHTTTGIIGLKYMLELLSLHLNRPDIAVTMLQKKDYPSLGFMLTNDYEPATTIWELWDSYKEGPGMNSRNHIMFGGPVGGWFYKFLGGIRPQATAETAGR